jgi:hypothetical protein
MDEPECPGPDCLMCNGEACNLCGAGCWNNRPDKRCEHAVDERHREPTSTKPKPTHYKVICISMYSRDIEDLNVKVAELKRRGWTKANKSQLIRIALSKLDLDDVTIPKL